MSDHLPEQLRFSHEYLLYLNDMLSSIVVEGEQARIFEVEFALDNAAQAAEIEGLSSEASWTGSPLAATRMWSSRSSSGEGKRDITDIDHLRWEGASGTCT